jgi:hypothetical protein
MTDAVDPPFGFPPVSAIMSHSVPDAYPLRCPFCGADVPDCQWHSPCLEYQRPTPASPYRDPVYVTPVGIFCLLESADHPLVHIVDMLHQCSFT